MGEELGFTCRYDKFDRPLVTGVTGWYQVRQCGLLEPENVVVDVNMPLRYTIPEKKQTRVCVCVSIGFRVCGKTQSGELMLSELLKF